MASRRRDLVRLIGAVLVLSLALVVRMAPAQPQPPPLQQPRSLRLFIPYINHFSLKPEGTPHALTSAGFWGVGAGLTFRHHGTQYLGLSLSAAIDYEVPVPVGVDYQGEHESMTTTALDLSNNRARGRFTFGYGVSYGWNEWRLNDDLGSIPVPLDRKASTDSGPSRALSSHALGLVFPVTCALNERFAVGFTYRPYLYRPGRDAGFHYEHVISVEAAWCVGLF